MNRFDVALGKPVEEPDPPKPEVASREEMVNHITGNRLIVAPSPGSLTITCPNGYQTTVALRNLNIQPVVDQFDELSGRIGGVSWLQIALPQPIIQSILDDVQESRREAAQTGNRL